ncbi:putative B3 domain-containing protein [Acorus gramineus]|uniref:B3 domain-containing protein n=1 Tax=Acorus gramineus TaxID=55184 RepID=A0AAV9BJ20_ACOGR|nr:putative B3 domain-containing protein [Acorus gramineus]
MPSTHSPTKTGKCSPPPTPSPKWPAKCMSPSSPSTKGVQIVEIKTEPDDQPIYSSKSHVKSDEASLSKMDPSIEERKERLSKAVRSVASTFPYFTKFMTKSNLIDSQVVRIPTRFVEYLPLQKAKMVLRDPTGWPWTVNYIRSNDNILSGGWTAFMRNNNLEVGDLCLFELIKPLELKVHIFKHSK